MMLRLLVFSGCQCAKRSSTFSYSPLYSPSRFLSISSGQHQRVSTEDTPGRMSAEEEDEVERLLQKRLEENAKERWRRKRLGMVGAFMAVFFGTQAVCLIKRRNYHHKMNKKMRPIPFEEFAENELQKGLVEGIVYQPNFGVLDVFLNNLSPVEEKERMMKQFLSTFSTGPERFERQPDLRVTFTGTPNQLEKKILEIQQLVDGPATIYFENNGFPSFRETAFMLLSTLIAVVCVAMVKI
ncbi:hypothetical protein M3Y95_01080600 [Aphelenchoides besseyi]|nr:hypothetical protein M3Y95_01080600 [Aphelenchoides besseyi]